MGQGVVQGVCGVCRVCVGCAGWLVVVPPGEHALTGRMILGNYFFNFLTLQVSDCNSEHMG